MSADKETQIREMVRDQYGQVARGRQACCDGQEASPCGCGSESSARQQSLAMGYSEQQIADVPEGANLGLGCGNPVALADLGAGAGFDCFLAARAVGPEGHVIGVDMTAAMLDKARRNTAAGGYTNVEFRLGEIEHLPVADNAVDAIISNCVINLSPDKPQVFAEALRVLRPGGRLMVSDMVLLNPLPDAVQQSVAAYVGCVAGAVLRDDYLAMIHMTGFEDVTVQSESAFADNLPLQDPLVQSILNEVHLTPEEAADIGRTVVSIQVSARKPN